MDAHNVRCRRKIMPARYQIPAGGPFRELRRQQILNLRAIAGRDEHFNGSFQAPDRMEPDAQNVELPLPGLPAVGDDSIPGNHQFEQNQSPFAYFNAIRFEDGTEEVERVAAAGERAEPPEDIEMPEAWKKLRGL